ncbi:unnamed protein product [Zymoseptoria tritici ST99CH_1A5]|uniref:Uncharacterized protein n=1 Tax=Zymoseptoria tritici ST99CH_1A5 TaxID=1276529 RepID=A0A1Y6L2B7_ZYMTR|nr:unnamed protein product [Zymoseptoria tritici ST99CH_1A5]
MDRELRGLRQTWEAEREEKEASSAAERQTVSTASAPSQPRLSSRKRAPADSSSSNEPPRKRRVTNNRKSASASTSTNQPELQLPPQEGRILRTRISPPKFNQRIEAPVVTELRQLCRMLICGTRMLIDAPRKLVTVDLDSIKTCKDLLVNPEPFDPSHGKILDNIWNVAKATSDRWNQALQDPAHIKKAHARCVHDWRPVVARLAAAVQGVVIMPRQAGHRELEALRVDIAKIRDKLHVCCNITHKQIWGFPRARCEPSSSSSMSVFVHEIEQDISTPPSPRVVISRRASITESEDEVPRTSDDDDFIDDDDVST